VTRQPPGQTTPPVVDVPPATRPPAGTPTPRAPTRPPAFPPFRPPPRRRARPPRSEEEERETRRQREPASEPSFGTFERVDTGGPASSFFSETVSAFGLGAFSGGRGPAEGTAGEFIGGGPTQAAVSADGDDAERSLFFAPALSVGDGSDDGSGDTDGGFFAGSGGLIPGFGGGSSAP